MAASPEFPIHFLDIYSIVSSDPRRHNAAETTCGGNKHTVGLCEYGIGIDTTTTAQRVAPRGTNKVTHTIRLAEVVSKRFIKSRVLFT